MATPTYNEIRRLIEELRTETKVKARRELGSALYNKLKNENILRKLAVEATPAKSNWPDEDSIVAKRYRAISLVWSSAIQGAIHVTQSIITGKKIKLTEQDVALPYNLLLTSDKANEILGEPSVAIPILPKKMVRTLLKYALELLGDDDITVGRLKLLEMLSFLCSKPDYVGVFKHHHDVANILGELFSYLTAEVEDTNVEFFNEAAKALDNLVSSTKVLGIEIHIFVDSTIAIIAAFFKVYLGGHKKIIRPQAPALPHLYNTIANILYAHPDYAIGPMKRHGRTLLRHAKKCYANAKSPCKEALNSYVAAHLFLSQFAGSIQGKSAGNMGDLGKASLTPEVLDQLADLVVKDLSYVFEKSKTPGNRQRSITWSVLDSRQRQHLELASRLLASAQQVFLCNAQWDAIDDPVEFLLSSVQTPGQGDEALIDPQPLIPPSCPNETITKSPWMQQILRPVAGGVDWRGFLAKHFSQQESPSTEAGTLLSDYITLTLTLLGGRERTNDTGWIVISQTMSHLAVIGACAELFPAGQCWTSNIFGGSVTMQPIDCTLHDVVVCQRCTSLDLALIVFLLAALLDAYGGSTDSQEAQMWILVALTKLTTPTSQIYRHHVQVTDDSPVWLAQTWQSVWQVLFRHELRYAEYTKDAGPYKLGELVLVLIREIVRNKCTDPLLWQQDGIKGKHRSFLHRHQNQVWSLRVFRNAASISSAVPFEIIAWMCHNVGISDDGIDLIDPIPTRSLMTEKSSTFRGSGMPPSRRLRLIGLGLFVIERCLRSAEGLRTNTVQHVMLAILGLIHGRIPCAQLAIGSRRNLDNIDFKFTHTTCFHRASCQFEDRDSGGRCLEVLWTKDNSISPSSYEHYSSEYDFASYVQSSWIMSVDAHEIDDAMKSVDFVSDTETFQLHRLVHSSFRQMLFAGDESQSDISEELLDDEHHSCLFQQLQEPKKSLALKMLATFHLGAIQFDADETTNLRNVMDYVVVRFNRLDQVTDAQSQAETLAHLSQICQSLLEKLSIHPMNFHLPQLSAMADTCRFMLRAYMQRLTEEPGNAKMRQDGTRNKQNDDDLMDDEILEIVPVVDRSQARLPVADSSSDDESRQLDRRKRKRSISLVRSQKTPRSIDSSLTIQNLRCAEEVARLLLALEPSVKNCEIVCQALLGADHELDPVDLNGDVDLRSAGLCLSLLTSPAVLSHGHASTLLSMGESSPQSDSKDSAITLLHKVLDLIRVNARPTDWVYLNGFQQVASIHKNLVDTPRSSLLSSDHQCLLELMLYKDSTNERPYLRAARILAATTAFRDARDDFHVVLDKHFSGLVKMGMSDSDMCVRRVAYSGVSAALLSLDERKALSSINKLICPISISQNPTERLKQYEEWYRHAGMHDSKDEHRLSDDFLNAFEIFEADSIRCRAVIAGSVANHDQFIDSIFELSMIALARPELQCACFRALDKVAQMRNYGSIEKMIESESPALLFRWIANDHDSLPLLVTAPSIVRWHSQYGGAMEWRGKEIDTEGLRLDAFVVFAAKKMHLLVPLSLFHSVLEISASDPVIDVDETKALSWLLTSQKLRLLALMSYDDLTNEDSMQRGLKRLVHRHVPDIQAFRYPMLQSIDGCHQQTAKVATNILTSILSLGEVNSRTKTKAQIFVRRVIDLTSFSQLLPSILPSHHLPYIDALTSAIESWTVPIRISGDKLRYVGTNAIASLIRSFAQLDKLPLPSHNRGMWKAITLQCEMIQRQTGNDKEKQNCIGFSIHMLTEIMLKEKFSLLRPDALSLVIQLLESGIGHGFQVAMVPLVKRLVGACVYIHEKCQKQILQEHRQRATLFSKKVRRSSGLVLLTNLCKKIDDVWGWDVTGELEPHLSSSPSTYVYGKNDGVKGTIVGTYDIIKWVIDHSTQLGLDSLAFVPMASPHGIPSEDIAFLSSMNESFAVQRLAACHFECLDEKRPTVEALSMELESTLRNRHSWMMTPSHGGLNLDQRLILAILNQLEFRAYDEETTSQQSLEELIRSLSMICRASCPEKLQIGATRCLAKMEPDLILRMHKPCPSQTLNMLLIYKPDDRAIPQPIKSKCLEALSGCLMSADPVVSQTAVETLEALLLTSCGQQALHLISNESVQSQIGTFCPSGTRKDRSILLSSTYIKTITVRAGIPECNLECDNWCWREKLWLCFQNSRVSFEEWVCGLTSSLIVCCVSSLESGQITHRDADGEFLWLCQKICAFEHNIALLLFPFVTIYLLGVSSTNTDVDYNVFFTKSFTSVLRSALRHEGIESCESTRKACHLIVNTVDTLRQTSQARFLSRKHARNVMKVVRKDGTPKSNTSAFDYNAGLPDAALWEGMPYGVMLRLDGLLVAEACIFVNRYASALFFLELYLNAKFTRVGEVFDELSHSIFAETNFRSAASDISGSQLETVSTFTSQEVKGTILKVMSLVGYCYKSIGEYDAFEAVMTQRAAIEFNAFGWNVRQAAESRSDALGLLRSLNIQSNIDNKDKAMIVVDSMESLDLNALLQSYLEGILSTGSSVELLKDNGMHRLKEKWYENELRKKRWDLLDIHSSQVASPTALAHQIDFHGNRHVQSQHFRSQDSLDQGFFSAIGSAHGFYLDDDRTSCQACLDVARQSVISDISKTGGIESPLSGMVEAICKLRTIESIARVWDLCHHEDSTARQFGSTLELMATRLHDFAVAPVSLGEESAVGVMWISELATSVAYAKKHVLGDLPCQDVFESLITLMCELAVRARRLERPHVAAEAIQRLHRLLSMDSTVHNNQDDPLDLVLLLRLEESNILESQGDFKEAIRKSQQIVDHLIQKENTSGLSSMHLQHILTNAQLSCGGWLTKYKVRQAGSVLKGYLQPGADRAKSLYKAQPNAENADRTARASLALGQISSSLHAALVVRVQSTEWKQSSSTAHQVTELERCEPLLHDALYRKNKAKKGTKQFDDLTRKWEELFIYCEHLRKDLQRTNEERDNVLTSLQQYLRLALESYSTALALASTGFGEDLLRPVSELISLWFENYKLNNDGEFDVNKLMKKVAFEQVPSFRFVPLTNQLFSRIEQSDDPRSSPFQIVLQELVFKMCAQHPYHCILPLLALANGKKVGSGVSGRHASAYIENVGNSKVAPASEIMSRLKKEGPPYVVGLLESYAVLGDSYIHLAGADTSAFHKQITKDISFSKVYSNSSMALDKCLRRGTGRMMYPPAIFTSVPTLQPDGNYGDGLEDPIGAERVRGFKPLFSITETGLHRPKIVICLGTKGGEFRQLVKGEDEIRQDAIMCQVFSIVNDLMLRRRSTGARKTKSKQFHHQLRIATYRVVPLSPASGVLEWVENTVAFGDVIFGRSPRNEDVGLHARYYPKEWNYLVCRRHFVEAPLAVKRETYDVVCHRFSPCFRFFFIERFGHDMMEWHAARMRYTRSVAVSSMVGHILGIGDRHTSNILVHTKTGEVVQIDFGIVFEQGKLLHTPERVPFRLTRNMVDGMGPCGTEGTFVRSSEETMLELRKNSGTLLTILSAVVADPLYKWSVSPVEGMRRQTMKNDDSISENDNVSSKGEEMRNDDGSEMADDKNEMGKKALAKINDKLQGYEESTSGEQQGIEGQVQLLINSARDVDNLCRMYPGWSPFV